MSWKRKIHTHANACFSTNFSTKGIETSNFNLIVIERNYTFRVLLTALPTRATPTTLCRDIIKYYLILADRNLKNLSHKRLVLNSYQLSFFQIASCLWNWSDLMQLDLRVLVTTCITLVQKKSRESTCIKTVDKLAAARYHQARASDVNASWYRLDDCKATSLHRRAATSPWLCN